MAGRAFVSRFSPNRTDPKILEAIFVQRHALADTWFDRLRDSALTEAKHHLLAVGPRGCGKSHLVALLVARLESDPQVTDRLRIAWLPEDETTPSFWKFLLRILRALNARYGDEFPPPPRDGLEGEADDRRARVLTDYLVKKLSGHALLVVVENLDDVFRGLKAEGQRRWRAFLQECPIAATLATSQQLTEDISDRDRPFFNFFQVEHLKPLTADEAVLLLQKIAAQSGTNELLSFLNTPTGRARVRAIHHLAGGGHRVFIILSEFATQEKLDNLVSAFEELLDELTPYYQERLRWLPDQQREIVEFLCRQTRTVPVKEIASELYLTEQTAASQLRSLKEKGYVTGAAVGRESRYELAESLMRLCIEVKDPRREPIRLVIDFLRVWYDQERLPLLSERFAGDGKLSRYLEAVAREYDRSDWGPTEEALSRAIEAAAGDPERLARVAEEVVTVTTNPFLCRQAASELINIGLAQSSIDAFERATELDPENILGWLGSSLALGYVGDLDRALEMIDRALRCAEPSPALWGMAHGLRAIWLTEVGRYAEAIKSFQQIKTNGIESEKIFDMMHAVSLNSLGQYQEAKTLCDSTIAKVGPFASLAAQRGRAQLGLGAAEQAVIDFRQALAIDSKYPPAFEGLAAASAALGDWPAVEDALTEWFRLVDAEGVRQQFGLLPDIIVTIFGVADRRLWSQRVRRLLELTENHNDNNQKSSNYLHAIGTALVDGLKSKIYKQSINELLAAWGGVWKEAVRDYPDLALAVRVFGVGVQYLQTQDERVLLDLVQEEREILRNVFKLDEEGTQQDEE